MINIGNSKPNFGIIFSILAAVTAIPPFSCYGSDKFNSFPSQSATVNDRVKTLVENTWKDGITSETFDHLTRIQPYVKNLVGELSPKQQLDLKHTLEMDFLKNQSAETFSSPNHSLSIFSTYLINLFNSSYTPTMPFSLQIKRPRSSSTNLKSASFLPDQSLDSFLAKLNLPISDKSPSMEEGIFTFIDPRSPNRQTRTYQSIKQKSTLDEEGNDRVLEYPSLETDILFINASNKKIYIAYDVSQSLCRIKSRLLYHYQEVFLPNLEGKNVKFIVTDKIIKLNKGEEYPLAEIIFSLR
ncbi:MAG: hypothetical protein K0M45_02595 [Candidatus Paracaedibacteraceae bacterium]|nr:hypothetical protein [Candidatus Paracaedibacteraceae bacterium]